MKKNEFKISIEETLICKICNKNFLSSRLKMSHIKKEHELSPKEYIIKVYYNNIHPVCLCGCNIKMEFTGKKLGPFFKNYTCYHNESSRIKKIKTTKKNRYGNKNYCNVKKIKETKIERYNNENYNNREKSKQTNLKKYGVEHNLQRQDIKEKSRQTKIERYNNENYVNHQKARETKKERYGNENYNNIEKSKQTRKNRYGNENYNNIEKIQQTKLKNHGNKNYNNRKKARQVYFSKICNRLQNIVIPIFSIEEYNGVVDKKYKFQCKQCNNIFYDNLNNGKVPRCLKCFPYLIEYSKLEKEIFNYIKTIYNGTIIENSRKILHGLELDIYIPDKNLAIEFDGLFWHSEVGGKKNKNYHLQKTKSCEDQGIHLIHIFEDEWLNKQDIVKSRLQHILGQNNGSIFARNCQIREITPTEKQHFLDHYHIQGNDKSAIKLGLFNDRELIAAMTFGKRRLALGKKSSEEGEFELLRFVTSKNVAGGAGKLLKYFIKNYNPIKIISYADRRWTYKENNLYEKIGFKKVNKTSVNYWYIKQGTRIHRFNFRKQVLNKKLKNFDKNLTEWQNMQLNNYDRIWDCGSLKYELKLNKNELFKNKFV